LTPTLKSADLPSPGYCRPPQLSPFCGGTNALSSDREGQSGGYLRTGHGPAPVTECDQTSGLGCELIAESARLVLAWIAAV
jgi:hypothetical protein